MVKSTSAPSPFWLIILTAFNSSSSVNHKKGWTVCPLSHVFAYICANARTGVLKKNLTFFSYDFGKGEYTFYPVKLSRFAKKR